MKFKEEDIQLLRELCNQYNVSFEKMLNLLDTTKEFEFRERRAGIYDKLSEIIKSDHKASGV